MKNLSVPSPVIIEFTKEEAAILKNVLMDDIDWSSLDGSLVETPKADVIEELHTLLSEDGW